MSALRSYHTDQIVHKMGLIKHVPPCKSGEIAMFKCICTPVKGEQITIQVWDDYVVEVKEAENVKG